MSTRCQFISCWVCRWKKYHPGSLDAQPKYFQILKKWSSSCSKRDSIIILN